MLTSREQSAALRFAVRRRVSALTRGLSDGYADAALPKERSLTVGVVLTLLVAAATAGYGWLSSPQTDPLPRHGTVQIAGSSDYVVMLNGVAHPALNTASALLASDSVRTVKAGALAETPRGAPIGIAGAPDSIPSASALTDDPWALCVLPGDEDRTAAVVIGGDPLPTLATHQAFVLAGPDGRRWMAVAGLRFAISGPALIALGISPDAAVPVPQELLDLLVVGTPLDPGQVAEPVEQVVRRTTPTGTTYFAVLPTGIAALTPVSAALLSDGPATEVASAQPTVGLDVPSDWPIAVPQSLDLTDLIGCVSSESGELSVMSGVPAAASLVSDEASSSAVIIRPGSAALVRMPGEPHDEYLLVTDAGRAYRIEDDTAVRRLGYEPDSAVDVPAAAYALLPRGPDLSVSAATAVAS